MSDTPSVEEVSVTSEPGLRPGRVLAEARVQKQLSVADVALQLKLSVSQVEALEAEAYDRLPGPVFVRGFVRNYARLLDLDGDALVAGLELERKGTSAMAAVPRSHNIPFPAKGKVRWPAYLAVLLLVIVAVVVADLLSSPLSTAPPPVAKSVPAVPQAPVTVPAPAVPAQSDKPETAKESGVVAAAPAEAAPAAKAPIEAAPVATPARSGLHFTFDIESWVEVRDRNNRILFSQLNPAGSEQHVQGQSPFSLVIGNARGVRLNYNGNAVDLAPHTRIEVARLTLE